MEPESTPRRTNLSSDQGTHTSTTYYIFITLSQSTTMDDLCSPTSPRGDTRPLDWKHLQEHIGIIVPYQYDDDIPWDAWTIMEDLLFRLDQKSDKVLYLQCKINSANRMSRIRKRDDSIDKNHRPSKQWGRSHENDSSYDLSPITETRTLEHPPVSSTGRDSSAYSGLSAIARLPLQLPGDRPRFAQPLVIERPIAEITR